MNILADLELIVWIVCACACMCTHVCVCACAHVCVCECVCACANPLVRHVMTIYLLHDFKNNDHLLSAFISKRIDLQERGWRHLKGNFKQFQNLTNFFMIDALLWWL